MSSTDTCAAVQAPFQTTNSELTNGHAHLIGNAVAEKTCGLIPWMLKQQGNAKQA